MDYSGCPARLRPCLVVVLGVAFALSAAGAWAQNAQGTIVGHVGDPTGASLPGAKVTVTDTATNVQRTVTTSGTGDYTVPDLNPGTYSIGVAAKGFASATSPNVLLEVQQTLRQDFRLSIGNISSTVKVSANTQMLHTEDTTVGQVIQGKMIQALPMNGRDFTNLMQTNAGTTVEVGGDEAIWSYHGVNTEFISVSANGTQAQSQSYSIDGITDEDYEFSTPINIPNELAIQEFKMMNGMYGAEYGPGAVQVNVAIKSGTNQLHGAAYESLQANWLQPSNQYVAAQNAVTGSNLTLSPPFHQNQFGGTLGGPLIIPHIYNGKNKTFWFGSYDEALFSAINNPTSVFVPTPAELSGDFSSWPFPIYNPLTSVPNPTYNSSAPLSATNSPVIRMPFAHNQIPASMIDPVAVRIAAYFGNANNPTCNETLHLTTACTNYTVDTRTTRKQGVGTARIDQYFGANDHAFFTVNIGNLSQTNGSISFGQGSTTYARPKLFGATWTHTFNANTLNQATLGYSRQHFFSGPTTSYGPNLSAMTGLANSNSNPVTYDLPNTCLTNYYCIGGGEPTTYVDNLYQGADNVTMVRGRHTLNFGINFQRLNLFEFDNYGGTGSLNFNGEFTAIVPGLAGKSYGSNGSFSTTAPYEGSPVADFLLGDPSTASGPPPIATDDYLLWGNEWNLYFEDDYRASDRLTLNAGLRWYRPPDLHSTHNDGYAFSTANGGQFIWAKCSFTAPILAAGGNPNFLGCGASNTLVPVDEKDFAPRLGFAYRPVDKAVIRGGFGIFYGLYNRYYDGTQFDRDSLYNLTATTYPTPSGTETQSTAVMRNLWAPPANADQLFVTPGWKFPFNQVNWPHNHNPYDEQWLLDTEYSLTPTLMLDVGYVGDHGLRQPSQDIIGAALPPRVANDSCNSLADASLATGTDAHCLSDPNFQPIDTREPYKNMPPYFYANFNGFQSTYNALQVQLIERNFHGLTYHANYTWSKTMDLTSGINDLNGEPNLIQDPQHPYQEYGLAASDQTNRFVIPFTYEVPTMHFAHHYLNGVTAGWTASGVYQMGSGLPFAVYGGEPTDQMGENYAGRILADSTYQKTAGFKSTLRTYFDTSQYSTPPLGRYGNTNKSPERTPYIQNLDASFGKTTQFREGASLMVRVEFFNLGSTWHSPNSGLLFPDSTVTDSNFGSLINPTYGNVSLWNPRIMQLTGQITF